MIKFICYPKCTTCQKARKWLDDNQVEYEFRDIIVTHTNYPNEVKEYAEEDKIELAVALLGYLRYSPLKGLTDDNQLIQITYIMDDGTECVVAANDYTVWWKGKPSAIKDENTFVKMCNAVFFSES